MSSDMLNSVPCRREEIKIQEIDDEILLYNSNDHIVFTLNHSAKAIWSLCDGTLSILDIFELLSRKYNLHDEIILSDIKNTIKKFEENGLIEIAM